MKLKNLRLRNFRSYEEFYFEPKRGINIIVGKNASGKTNLLESIYTLLKGKSFRTNRDRELINFSKDFFEIKGELDIDSLLVDYEVSFKNNKKELKINDNKIKNLSQYTQDTAVVVFSPKDLELIKSGPSKRREFIDELISSVNMIYGFNLKRYEKLLSDRNLLLKKKYKTYDNDLLMDVYDIRLSSLGSYIISERNRWIEYLNKEIEEIFYLIANRDEKLRLRYRSNIKYENPNEIEKIYYNELKKNAKRDNFFGQTLIGPHRDEIVFYIDDKELKQFGSQGQQRTVVLALKLTEAKVYRKQKKLEPIIILDDVFSELDNFRRKGLLKSIGNSQSFLSTTDELDFYNIKIEKNIKKLKSK
ncbi:MAG: DNA replication/repair protein RecF [Tissierellia bacterium]|nr:DNA replication/repair protein RecF [Tissierellia bacterium]